MAGRRMHPSGRPQQIKRSTRKGETFAIRRPLVESSAMLLIKILDDLLDQDKIPEDACFQNPDDMAVTYIEKGKMSSQLRGWVGGFNTRGLVDGVTSAETMNRRIPVGLGRVGLMGTRSQVIVARIDHSQVVAEEYSYIQLGLAAANIPGVHKQNFKPHVSLLRLPSASAEEKRALMSELQKVIPTEIELGPIGTDPPIN